MCGCRQYVERGVNPRAVGLTVNEDDNANLDGLQARPEKLITCSIQSTEETHDEA